MNLTKKALDLPVTTFMIFTCLIVIGFIASRILPLEYFPDMDFPGVSIEIPYPGSTPEEVERRITRPAEEALATISRIKRMNSTSTENSCFINLGFDWNVDTDMKAVEVREKLDSIRSQWPDDVEHFFVNQASSSDISIMSLRLSSNRNLSGYYDMLNRVLKRPLERTPGVSKIVLYGAEKKEIRVQLLADRIAAHRVNLGQLSEVLLRSNFLVTAGRISDGNRRYRVRPMGELNSIAELEQLIVGKNNLRLKDIAQISYERPRMPYGRHLNRNFAVGVDVFKEAGANTVETAGNVKKLLQQIAKDPRMAGIRIYFMEDQADGILSSLRELVHGGLIGALLAICLLFFFMRRVSTTFIVALAIPFSLLVTMACMFFLNVGINILSMMGLLLAVGMLVDNAVVVTESIHRHQLIEKNSKQAALNGVKEVATAITAGTLTTVIVFLPTAISQRDETSMYLKFVAISFVIALGASLLLALTIVPLLTSRVKLPSHKTKPNIIDRLTTRYGKMLSWMVTRRKLSALIIILVIFSIVIPMMVVKMDMFPQQEDRRLRLFYNINGNYTLEKVEAAVDIVEDYLYSKQAQFEIESVYTFYQGDTAMSTILLKKGNGAKKSQEAIRKEIESAMPRLAVGKPTFEIVRSVGGEGALKIFLHGDSSTQLVDLSRELALRLASLDGLTDVRSEAESGEHEVQVVVDRQRAAQLGISSRAVADMTAIAMRGVNLHRFRDEYGEIDVRAEFQRGDKQTLDQLRELVIYDRQNNPIKLTTVANIRINRGPRMIQRENRITSIGIMMNLKDKITVNEASEKISRFMQQYRLPVGITWGFGRSFDFSEEAAQNMMIDTLLAVILIYFIMAAIFESLVLPAAIWSSIIFAIIGVWWFFMITGTTFSMMAWIGVLILIGVVVNNGIVLIDHINRFRENQYSRHEAIVQAGMERLRPILMTAGTTVLSLIPLCVADTQIGGDGPPYFPMARAIVGGLIFSTAVTLLILPRIYIMLDDLRTWSAMVIRLALRKAKV